MQKIKYYIFTLILSLASLSTTANADSYIWGQGSSYSPIQINIIDDSGYSLKQYATNNNSYQTVRSYIEATKGKRYKLRIKNNSNKRVAIVIAVDGRNILSGRKSYLRNNEKMYVLNPYESSVYSGWRTSKNHVNRFYFTSAGGSYANSWGDHSAMGVIAVAVFDEKRRHYKNNRENLNNGRTAPSKRGYFSGESTGTGFGHEEYSPTRNVRFKAKKAPSHKYFFKYEWRNTLCKRGITNCNSYEGLKSNNRFWPRETNNNGYAPYPSDYYLDDGRLDQDFSINLDW